LTRARRRHTVRGMAIQKCEKCSAAAKGFALFDYCASCSKNLCEACMKLGCCGKIPAESGMAEDGDDVSGEDGE
jgi:hypothetical protein